MPAVTFIVPVYNGEPFLAEALHSITTQGYAPLQVLVVDDGSTDQSAAIAAKFAAVTVLRKPHSGVAATLNYGLRHANGDFIAFLDADDRWLPGKLQRQVCAFQEQPEFDLVFGYVRQFTVNQDANGVVESYTAAQPGFSKITLLARHSAFQRIGNFDESGGGHDFIEWYARAQNHHLRSTMLSEVLAERRMHEANYGRTNPAEQPRAYLNTLRALVQQRRQVEERPSDG